MDITIDNFYELQDQIIDDIKSVSEKQQSYSI